MGAGVDPSSLSRWENDKVMPGTEELRLLCLYLQVSADELLGLTQAVAPAAAPTEDAAWRDFLARPVAQLAREKGVLEAVHRAQLQDPAITVPAYEAIAWHLVRSAVEKPTGT